jgi:hypothetical protein
MFDFFSKEDKQLYNMLGHLNMAEKEISLKDNSETEIYEVAGPDDKYAFLHEAAIIEYHSTLWLSSHTPRNILYQRDFARSDRPVPNPSGLPWYHPAHHMF